MLSIIFLGETLSKKQIRGVSPSLFLLPFQPPYDSSCLPASKHSWLFAEIVCGGCGWWAGVANWVRQRDETFQTCILLPLLLPLSTSNPLVRSLLLSGAKRLSAGEKRMKKRTLSAASAAAALCQCAEFAPGLANHLIH